LSEDTAASYILSGPHTQTADCRLNAGVDEKSNFDLLKDLAELVDFLKNKKHWAEEELRI